MRLRTFGPSLASLGFVFLLGLALAVPAAEAQGRGRPGGGGGGHGGPVPGRQPPGPEKEEAFIQITPEDQVVEFQQICWDLDQVVLGPSNWGQVSVDPNALLMKFKRTSGYFNVFLYTPGSNLPHWSVENLSVAPASCFHLDGGPPRSDARSAHHDRVPVCQYLDLTPELPRHRGDIRTVEVVVLLSAAPLPAVDEIFRAAQEFAPARFEVRKVTENAEGFTADPLLGTFPPRDIQRAIPLGPPPPPVVPGLSPDLDLAFPICVLQEDGPNIQCARNQCVPMAQANALQWLEDKYYQVPLIWSLPHPPVPGIGRQGLAGDIVFWEPIPDNSLVAHIDFFTRRVGVFSPSTGKGSTICQLYRGLFGYLEEAEPHTAADFRHQGTDELVLGDGAECDSTSILLGGRQSFRQGQHPTWEWMFEQLTLGRAVTICFGRYDPDGNRTSGHCVRVWGACRIGESKYIRTLDDGQQANNSAGLRTQWWKVEDIGGPGLLGIPDGRLNMNGMSWEIEFANSIRARPDLVIP